MEEYVIGFRAIGSHMAFISEVLPGKDGDKVYIYGTNNRKKVMKFSFEEAEQIVKQSKIPDVTMMKA